MTTWLPIRMYNNMDFQCQTFELHLRLDPDLCRFLWKVYKKLRTSSEMSCDSFMRKQYNVYDLVFIPLSFFTVQSWTTRPIDIHLRRLLQNVHRIWRIFISNWCQNLIYNRYYFANFICFSAIVINIEISMHDLTYVSAGVFSRTVHSDKCDLVFLLTIFTSSLNWVLSTSPHDEGNRLLFITFDITYSSRGLHLLFIPGQFHLLFVPTWTSNIFLWVKKSSPDIDSSRTQKLPNSPYIWAIFGTFDSFV